MINSFPYAKYVLGVQVIENCSVTGIRSEHRKVKVIETNLGAVESEFFVNCGGFWARHIGQLSKPTVKVPVHPVEHYYLQTKPVPNLDSMTPGMLFQLLMILLNQFW